MKFKKDALRSTPKFGVKISKNQGNNAAETFEKSIN